MDIGIPREISIEEKRISLAPQGVYTLIRDGNEVYIEKGAGLDSEDPGLVANKRFKRRSSISL